MGIVIIFTLLLLGVSILLLPPIIHSKRKHNISNYRIVKAQFPRDEIIYFVVEYKGFCSTFEPLRRNSNDKIIKFYSYKGTKDYIESIVYKDNYKRV